MKSLKLHSIICFLQLLLVNEFSALQKTYQINNQDLKSFLDITTNQQHSRNHSPVSFSKRLRNGNIIQLIESEIPQSGENIFVKRILLNVVGGRHTSVASQKLLDWLSTAPSRELFANYGKRLSDILVSVSGGHQAWFSGYGKRSTGDDSSKQNDLKSHYQVIPHLGQTIQSHPFEYKPFIIQKSYIHQNRQAKGHIDDNGLRFSATNRKKRSVFPLDTDFPKIKNKFSSFKILDFYDSKHGTPVQSDNFRSSMKRSGRLGVQDQQSRVRDYVKRLERNFQTHQAWFAGYGKRSGKDTAAHQAWFAGYGKRSGKDTAAHQAWFAGYGKRESKDSASHQALLNGYNKRNPNQFKDHKAWFAGYGKRPEPNFQTHQAWFAGYGKRGKNLNSDHQAWFAGYGKRGNNLNSNHQAWFAGYAKRGKINLGHHASYSRKRRSKVNSDYQAPLSQKRRSKLNSDHQAWFAGYGKRGSKLNSNHHAWIAGDGKRGSKLNSDHQAWFAGYGKRGNKLNSDHQAWFAGYGKRGNKLNSDHQAWFAGYGKRGNKLNSDHQAWFAGYGKRPISFSKNQRILSNLKYHSIIPNSSKEHIYSYKNNHKNEPSKTKINLDRGNIVIPNV